MSERDDILVLASKGLFEEAISTAMEIEDPLERVDSLIDVALKARGSRPDLIPELLEFISKGIKKVKDRRDRAYLYSRMAYLHSLLGNEEASEFFDRSLDEASRIKDVGSRAVALALIAYHLALSGFLEDAMELFNDAFDMAISAEMDYRTKLDVITEIAGLMESAGDSLHSREAIPLYETAYDIFDKLRVSHRAADVEKKLTLARVTYLHGLPEIREALLEGKYQYAVKLVEKTYRDPQERFLALLQIAHWMKRVGAPEYLDVLGEALELLKKVGLRDKNVQKAAAILTEMGELEKALRFAAQIADPMKKDDALAAIALKLAERKDFMEAREVAAYVSDSMLRAKLLDEIARIEEKAKVEV